MMTEAKSFGIRSSAEKGVALEALLTELSPLDPRLTGSRTARVLGVRQDSRDVEAGDLFVARAGASANGAAFVEEAARRGAACVLVEAGVRLPELALPVLRVSDARRALGLAAERVYGHPSRRVPLVGITGTNGKTTVSFLIEQALLRLGERPARLGTLGFSFLGREEEGAHTTPEADAISRRLAHVASQGGTSFVMEVSSHALELERVTALSFAVAAFTNLSQDHLDFHGSMEKYAATKGRLFTELSPQTSVIHIGDAFGLTLSTQARGRAISVSARGPADVQALRASFGPGGSHATLAVSGRRFDFESRLLGAHNLENSLVALGVLLALGHDAEVAAEALGACVGAPGRLERCDEPGDELLVVVDYAHTPDALERVLDALRPLTRGRLLCVFGCGGDRDPSKRPLMGAAVAERADFAVVTSDNPRSERPELIADAILPPLSRKGLPYEVELDRARAIQRAIAAAAPGDAVLIAGKGHENYQIVGTEKRPFDDRAVAKRALALRREGLARQ